MDIVVHGHWKLFVVNHSQELSENGVICLVISKIRNSKLINALWGLMGLFLLNISVDTSDPDPAHIPEDLSFNDQESFVEILVEEVLGFENAFIEYDDNDTQDHTNQTSGKIDLLIHSGQSNCDSKVVEAIVSCNYPSSKMLLATGFSETDSPPPKS